MNKKIVFLLLSFLFFIKSNAQCAMCRAVLESGDDQSMAEGINDGIVFLMAVPYILIGTIGYIIYRKFNKSNKIEKID